MNAAPPPYDRLIAQIVALDRIADGLDRYYREVNEMFGLGGAARTHLLRYNVLAADLYASRRAVLDLLRDLGVPGVAPRPPFPPVFTTPSGAANLVALPEVVTRGQALVYFQHPDAPELKTGELALAPIVWLGIGLGVGALVGYFGGGQLTQAITEVSKQRTLRLTAELASKETMARIQYARWRALTAWKMTVECAKGDALRWVPCLTANLGAAEAAPTPSDLPGQIEKLARALQEPGRGLFWWIGGIAVVALVTAGGIAWWQHRQRQRTLPPRREKSEAEAAA